MTAWMLGTQRGKERVHPSSTRRDVLTDVNSGDCTERWWGAFMGGCSARDQRAHVGEDGCSP